MNSTVKIEYTIRRTNVSYKVFFRWEDGNNLTSNLFTLINNTGLLQHTKKYTRHTCMLI